MKHKAGVPIDVLGVAVREHDVGSLFRPMEAAWR
jgi:hypothetical protein